MSSVAGALPAQLAGLIVQLCSQLCQLHTCYNLAHLSGSACALMLAAHKAF